LGGPESTGVDTLDLSPVSWEQEHKSSAHKLKPRRRIFGVRWQAQRDTALDRCSISSVASKAPSPLCSAGALQRAFNVGHVPIVANPSFATDPLQPASLVNWKWRVDIGSVKREKHSTLLEKENAGSLARISAQ
jgi:hypothetical protein